VYKRVVGSVPPKLSGGIDMRKFSVLLLAFLLVGTFAFAQTLEERVEALEKVVSSPAFAVSGHGQTTFGVNLDSGATGFLNAFEGKVAVTFVVNHARMSVGEGDVYGQIAIKDIRVFGEGVNGEGEIKARAVFDYAKIVAGPLSVKVAGAPSIGSNLAAGIAGATVVAPASHDGAGVFTALPTYSGKFDSVVPAIATSGGVTIDYVMPGLMDIQIGLASVTSWQVADVANKNDYAFYGQVAVKAIPDATLTLRAMAGLGLDEVEYPFAFGAKFEYNLPVADFTLVPILAVDVYSAVGADDLAIEIGNGVRLKWAGRQEFELPHGWAGGDTAWSGVTVGYNVLLVGEADPVLNLNAAIVEDEAGGLVDGLGFVLSLGINDVLAEGDDMNLGLSTQVSYKVDNMTPYARLAMVPSLEQTTLWAGLKIVNVFPKTNLEFAYQSGNLNAEENTLGVFRTILRVNF
jgi:hypothetical protein